MKKGFALFTALFLISTFTAFAAVTAVKEGDVVKVTWTYENDEAASVGLVGDFQGWNLAGAEPMAKVDGKWTVTLEGKDTSEFKYKFNVDGEWTEDPAAPETTDDGFGGMNGYVIVANLLAGAGTPGAAPAPRGLNVGLFDAVWMDASAATSNPVSGVTGFEVNDVTLNHKAYLKTDGYIFPKLLYVATEFKIFDGNVQLYKKELVYNKYTMQFDPTETTSLEDGALNLAGLPWTMFQSFGMEWPDTQGKVRAVLELNDINTKISHAVGWSKTTKQDVGGLFLTYFLDPDANGGVTEVFPIKAFDFGGVTLDYLVNLDKSGGNYKSHIIAMPSVAGVNIEVAATLDSQSDDISKFADDLNTHLFLGASTKVAGISIKAQGKLLVAAEDKLTDAYYGALELGYGMENLFSATLMGSYAGADAKTGYADADDDVDGLVKGSLDTSLLMIPSVTIDLGGSFSAAYLDFTAPEASVTLGGSYKVDGLSAGLSTELVLPLDGADFAVDNVMANASVAGLNAELYWLPAVDFATNEIRLRATYDITPEMGVAAGVQAVIDADKNPVGVTLGYNLKTPFEAVKSPYFFTTVDYNLTAMDGDDGYVMHDIDSSDFVEAKSAASLRAGLRWNF